MTARTPPPLSESDRPAWALNPWGSDPQFIRLPDGWQLPYLIPPPVRPRFNPRALESSSPPIPVYMREFRSPYLGRFRVHCREGAALEVLQLLTLAESAILFVRWLVQVGTLGLWGRS